MKLDPPFWPTVATAWKKSWRETGLPLSRWLAGCLVGKAWLVWISDTNPIDAVAIGAGVVLVLGWFTKDWED